MKEKKQDNLGLDDARLDKLTKEFDLDALFGKKEENKTKKKEK